jgi:WD40 repeat protein
LLPEEVKLLPEEVKLLPEEVKSFQSHSSTVTSVAFFAKGKYLTSGSNDNLIKRWNLDTYTKIAD